MKLKFKILIKNILLIIVLLRSSLNLYSQEESVNDYVQGEIIVQLNSGIFPNQIVETFSEIGLNQPVQVSDILNIWLFHFSEFIPPDSCLNALKRSNLVKLVQFNHYIFLNSTPNDPGYVNQYALNKISAPNAWDITTGGTTTQNDQIVIAVIDAGFDINHQDLNFWKNTLEIPNNNIDDDLNGYIDDFDGWNAYNSNGIITSNDHGTEVAGIIGATGNNSLGISGINWNIKIMPIQASSNTEVTAVAGYSYALKMRQLYNQTNGSKGAYIVATNASFSVHNNAVPSNFPIWCGIYDALGHEGVLNINSPQNISGELGVDFTDVPGMCASDYLIVVTNTDQNDNLNSAAPWSTTFIDIAAPGTDIYTTDPGNNYNYESGTSFATPQVAGTVGLMYAAACNQLISDSKSNPSQTALTFKQFLLNWSDPVYSLLNKIAYGRLNVYRSIIKMSQQFDYDLYISGNETTSKQFDAIHNITIENYSNLGNFNNTFRAGNLIDIKPESPLLSGANGSFYAYIDKNAFDCAIPFQPLSVNLLTPANVICDGGFVPITCNAIPTGGQAPYSYNWTTEVTTSNSWISHSIHGPNIGLLSSEDFYVQVEVTDNRGYTALSTIKFVNCLDARFAAPDSTHSANELGLKYDSDNLKYLFNVFPNPTTGQIQITFSLTKESNVTIRIIDNIGGIVNNVVNNQHFGIGSHLIEYENKELPDGLYLYEILTDEGIRALKLIVNK